MRIDNTVEDDNRSHAAGYIAVERRYSGVVASSTILLYYAKIKGFFANAECSSKGGATTKQ